MRKASAKGRAGAESEPRSGELIRLDICGSNFFVPQHRQGQWQKLRGRKAAATHNFYHVQAQNGVKRYLTKQIEENAKIFVNTKHEVHNLLPKEY